MSDLREFMKEVRELQVMSPDRDTDKFAFILEGPTNYREWKRTFENVLFTYFSPLTKYYHSGFSAITDHDFRPITELDAVNIIRATYTNLLLAMLRSSVSNAIREDIVLTYAEICNSDDNAIKTLFVYLEEQYGQMTFEVNFEIVSKHYHNFRSSDPEIIKNNHANLVKAIENPILFKASTLLISGSEYTQQEMMRIYGRLYSFDYKIFVREYWKFQTNTPRASAAFFQTNTRKTTHKSKEPPSPCPLCKKNHWRNECPKRLTQTKEMANLASAFPGANLPISDEFSWKATTDDVQTNTNSWYLDTGCTSHIGRDRGHFVSLEEKPGPRVAGIANSVISSGSGEVRIDNVVLNDTLYVPEAPVNLISISKITKKSGHHIIFTQSGAYLTTVPESVINSARKIGSVENGLYKLEIKPKQATAMWTMDVNPHVDASENHSETHFPTSTHPGDMWHARLGHPGRAVYECLSQQVDLPKLPADMAPTCQTCALSKGNISKGKTSVSKATAPLELIQADICGSFRYKDYLDNKYFLTIIDKYSSYYVVIPLALKSHATEALKNWIRSAETHFLNHGGYKVSHVRTDNGGEFANRVLHEFFASRGITHELTVPHSSSQNGGVERAHGVLQTKMRTLLLGGRVPPYLWSEALLCAAYLHNHSPIVGKKGKIPYLFWNDKPKEAFNIGHLRTFGCAAYITMPIPNRDGKLLPTSLKGVMVGYDANRKAYRVYLPQKGTVVTSKDVRFDENDFPLADSEASHQAYDFATGVIKGAPPYPKSNFTPVHSDTMDTIGDQSINTSSMSYTNSVPASKPQHVDHRVLSTGIPSSSLSEPDTSSDSANAPSTDIPSPPATPSCADVKMPDYVPDQTDHIEDNTSQLLKQNQMIAKQQQTTQQLLSDVRGMMESLVTQRVTNVNPTSHSQTIPVPATSLSSSSYSPLIETPNSSLPMVLLT